MACFKDTAQREWQVKIDAPSIRAVRERVKVDLADNDGKVFDSLRADPVLLVDVLWVLVAGQHSGVDDLQFGQSLGGDSIDSATEALLTAALDFFPRLKRSLVHSLEGKQAELRAKAADLALMKINDPELEKNFLAKVERDLNQGFSQMLNPGTGAVGATSSPVSVESARTD